MTRARGIRIADELAREISREAEARGVSWAAMITALLTEALKCVASLALSWWMGPPAGALRWPAVGSMSGKLSRRGRPAGKMSGNWRRTIPG
jgi:hypothetical protein